MKQNHALDQKEDSFWGAENPQEISNAIATAFLFVKQWKIPTEQIDSILANYRKKRESYRSKTDFTTEEIASISEQLQYIADYWESQIKDSSNPQDNWAWNCSITMRVLDMWKESCDAWSPKLLEFWNLSIVTSENRDEILTGFAMRQVSKDHSN